MGIELIEGIELGLEKDENGGRRAKSVELKIKDVSNSGALHHTGRTDPRGIIGCITRCCPRVTPRSADGKTRRRHALDLLVCLENARMSNRHLPLLRKNGVLTI